MICMLCLNKPENIIKVQVNWKKSIQGPYYFELR